MSFLVKDSAGMAFVVAVADVGFVEIESDKGHDSFLLDVPEFLNALKNFLDKSYTTV